MPIFPEAKEFESPVMIRVQQNFTARSLADSEVQSTLTYQLQADGIRHRVKPGMRVAVGVGSRGIAALSVLVKTTIDVLQSIGAHPFIVPAMGSHGGATPAGQRAVLAHYGITEEAMGVPIEDTMETVVIGEVDGLPVHISRPAYESDLIVPVCRIKPHTDFKGPVESGALKMLAIGFGKHMGAATLHTAGFAAFDTLVPKVGQFLVDHAPVGFSVCVVENMFDQVETVQVILAENTATEEPPLLERAKALVPKINIDPIDLLIVDEIGKNISGEGMDPNVTGRSPLGIHFPGTPHIGRIAVLGLTHDTDGNATGIGMADFTTMRCFHSIKLEPTYTNVITAGVPASARIPLLMENDRELISVGLRSATVAHPTAARVVRIHNTLELVSMWVSEPIAAELRGNQSFTVTEEQRRFEFDNEGTLTW